MEERQDGASLVCNLCEGKGFTVDEKGAARDCRFCKENEG